MFLLGWNLLHADLYRYPQTFVSDDGKYIASWGVDGDVLRMKLEAQGTGWIGVGFTNFIVGNAMDASDIAVFNGTITEHDYWANGFQIDPDSFYAGDSNSVQDAFRAEATKTVVEFHRPLTASDPGIDVDLRSPCYLVWAFHETEDELTWHGMNRGHSHMMIDFSAAGPVFLDLVTHQFQPNNTVLLEWQSGAPGTHYTIDFSDDLEDWNPLTGFESMFATSAVVPLPEENRYFLRVRPVAPDL